jgi:hypothetical protein
VMLCAKYGESKFKSLNAKKKGMVLYNYKLIKVR